MIDIRSKLKILFISINNVWRYGNIGMDQLLGYLRLKGFNIDIKYFPNKPGIIDDICSQVNDEYDVIGFSVNSSNYNKCIQISEKIKKDKNIKIVFGGGYPTRFYREILNETNCVDYMILGDGEYPSEYLFQCLSINKYGSGIKINISHPSIVYKEDYLNKKACLNTKITWYPAFDYYLNDKKSRNSRKVHCIQVKNNVCTGNCTFCNEIHGKVVFKDIDDIVGQIEYVHANFGVKKIFFTDDNIFDPNNDEAKKFVKNLCLSLKQKNLKLAYQCYIKANSIKDTKEDHEILDLMKSIGFTEIFIGAEAGNQFDLDLYSKNVTVEQNIVAINMIRKHNIFPILGFIAFNPYSTKSSITQNFKFLLETKCTYLHNYLYSFVIVNKYTKFYDMIVQDNLITDSSDKYIDVQYKYKNSDVIEVLDYVKKEMIPKLNNLDYELDWVTYSKMEHDIWYDNITDYTERLAILKEENLNIIENMLSILFIDFNVNKFKDIENDFWNYFKNQEYELKEIYDYFISLHKMS